MNNIRWKLFFTLVFNIAFSAYYIVFGVITHSRWLLALGVYYVILSIVKIVVTKMKNDIFMMRFTGVMLIMLSLSLVVIVILAVLRDRGIVMNEIIMIAMAAYSFTKITFAIINLIKSRKCTLKKFVALRNISFVDACVSIFALQRSMLVSFEGMTEVEIRIANAVTGGVICIIVFLLGLNILSNKKSACGDLKK